MFDIWTDGVFPPLADEAERFARDDGVRLHSHAAAVNSSMVFGFNLFLPFRVDNSQPLASLLSVATGIELQIDRIQFEYGPSEILAETRSDPPSVDEPCTSSDAGIEVRDSSGRRGIVLVEVKLSEGGFTPCSGPKAPSSALGARITRIQRPPTIGQSTFGHAIGSPREANHDHVSFEQALRDLARRMRRGAVHVPRSAPWCLEPGSSPVVVATMPACDLSRNIQEDTAAVPSFALCLAWWFEHFKLLGAGRVRARVEVVGDKPVGEHAQRSTFLLHEYERLLPGRFTCVPKLGCSGLRDHR